MEFNYDFDTQGIRGTIVDFPKQCKKALGFARDITLQSQAQQIVVVAMGGSGIAGRLLRDYLAKAAPKIDVHLIQDYVIPEYITKEALAFIVSYSGNTEETVDVYRRLARKGVECVVIASGGKLAQIAPMFSSSFIQVPDSLNAPRLATGYLFMPMVAVLMRNGVIAQNKSQLDTVIASLEKDIFEPYAKDLVEKIAHRTPIIYGSSQESSICYKWKISLNETAKMFAFSNVLPEANHNEIESFGASNEDTDNYVALFIKDLEDEHRIQKRMDLFKEIIRKKGGHAYEIVIRSTDRLSFMLSAMYLGDWVSYYMALARGVDPTPIETIESFKKQLK